MKFLGIIFQGNCKWDQQIQKVLKSCVCPSNLISFLVSTWWGESSEILLLLFKALIRSRLEYASFVWFQIPETKRKALENIQFRNIRKAMGYRKSTPRPIMLSESKLPPIDIRVIYLGCNFISKCRANSNHPLIPILEEIKEIWDNPTFIPRNKKSCLLRCLYI